MAPETLQGIKEGEQIPLTDNIEITELHCHECDGYIKFALDKGKNGQHVVVCPKCGHEHCRTIENGKVTGDRWESRNKDGNLPTQITGNAIYYVKVDSANWSQTGWNTVQPGTNNDVFLNDSWGQTQNNAINIQSGTCYFVQGAATTIAWTNVGQIGATP